MIFRSSTIDLLYNITRAGIGHVILQQRRIFIKQVEGGRNDKKTHSRSHPFGRAVGNRGSEIPALFTQAKRLDQVELTARQAASDLTGRPAETFSVAVHVLPEA